MEINYWSPGQSVRYSITFTFTVFSGKGKFLEAKSPPDQSSAGFMGFKNPTKRRMIGDHYIVSPFLQGPDDNETFLLGRGVVSFSLIQGPAGESNCLFCSQSSLLS